MHGCLDERGEFLLPVRHQGDAFGGDAGEVDKRIDAVDKCRRQVADLYSGRRRELVGVTAAEYKAFARKQAAVGIEAEILRDDLCAPFVVIEAQRVGSDGDVFAFAVGCARALRIAARDSGPEDVALAGNHTHDPFPDFGIGLRLRHGSAIGVISATRVKSVCVAPLGVSAAVEQHLELSTLNLLDTTAPRERSCALVHKPWSCKWSKIHFRKESEGL